MDWSTRVAEHPRLAAAIDLGRRFVHGWIDDRLTGLAAEVAFFGLLSIFPALLATASALGFLDSIAGGDVAERVQQRVVEYLETVLTDQASESLDAVQELFAEGRGGLFTVAMVGAIWSASRGTNAVMRALGEVYDVTERRSWWRQRLVALGLLALTVLAVAVALTVLVIGPLLGGGRQVADAVGLGGAFATAWTWARPPLAIALLAAWATVVCHVAPGRRTPWREDVPGGVLAAGLWIAVSLGLRLYLEVAGTANQVFGVLGGVLIVVVWLYLLSLSLLAGGELNAVLLERRRDRAGPPSRLVTRSSAGP